MRLVLVLTALVGVVLCADDARPVYHFTPPANWMNDPNGPMYWPAGNNYHLFYQYNPNAAVWGDMHWGHAVSKDLVNWEYLPIALSPDQSYDSGGVWSGSALVNMNEVILYYTGVSGTETYQVQCIATPANLSDPNLINWIKSTSNPVMEISQSLFSSGELEGFRDPTTPWQHDGVWYMLVGSGASSQGGLIFLYKSTDLFTWSFVSDFYSQDDNVNNFYECPDYFTLFDKSVLKFSQTDIRMDTWSVGSVDYETSQVASVPHFVPESWGYVDYGVNTYYASKSFEDKNSNRYIWGWLTENDSPDKWVSRGWVGVQTIREVHWDTDNGLLFKPLEALQNLRENHSLYVDDINLTPSKTGFPLIKTEGNQLEIQFKISNYSSSDKFGINVLSSSDHAEFTGIFFTEPSGLLPNVNFPGGTYKTIVIPSGDETICQNYCETESLCYAWSFEISTASCALKTASCPIFTGTQGYYSGHKALFGVLRGNSSVHDPVTSDQTQCAPFSDVTSGPIPGEPDIPVHIFVDHSVIEIYVNGGKQVMSTRVYPNAKSTHVDVWTQNGYVTFGSLESWNIKAATFTNYQQEVFPIIN